MLRDFTRNLFYFFRGPSSDDGSARDRQLENNLTKSLIVVLEHSDNAFLQALFVRRLGLGPQDGPVRFSLQRRPVGTQTTPKRVVLGITGGGAEHVEFRSAAESGRPDAWILTDNWAVLVESKLGSKIGNDQLHRHAESAGWTRGSYDLCYLTWQDIYTVFRDELAKLGTHNPTSCLLVSQWLDYLEGQQMIPFEKLEPDDFDYFNLPEDAQDSLKSHVHQRLADFQRRIATTKPAARILKCCGLSPDEPWKHGAPRAGERQAWFIVGGEDAPRKWHATVFFRPHGVDVEAIGASKGLTLRLAKAGIETVAELVRLCSDGSDHLSIALGCARAWYKNPASDYKGQQIARIDHPMMAHPRVLAAPTRDKFAEVLWGLLRTNDPRYRTELIIQYSIPREEITCKHVDVSAQVRLIENALLEIQGPLEFLMSKAK